MEKQKQIELLREQLTVVQQKIKKLENVQDITNRVAASFHLGMVGSSGRNTGKLNKKREAALDRTIDRAIILTKLYAQERGLLAQIKDIEKGGPEKREANKKLMLEAKVQYWKSLKAGDTVPLWSGNEVKVKKKYRKSFRDENCTWTAAEIIGNDAAALL